MIGAFDTGIGLASMAESEVVGPTWVAEPAHGGFVISQGFFYRVYKAFVGSLMGW